MSLSSLLISKASKKSLDTELDALFTEKPIKQVATPIAIPGSSKDVRKKRKAAPDAAFSEEPAKRSKSSSTKSDKTPKVQATPKSSKSQKPSKDSPKKSNAKGKAKEVDSGSEDDSDLENVYDGARAGEKSEDDDDEEAEPVMHESIKKDKKAKAGPKVKFVPSDETPEQRDRRTIFVGNLSVDVAQKRPLLKQLHRHILSQIPNAKIESTRFRSIPFQAPTSKLPDDDDPLESGKPNPKATNPTTTKTPRTHDVDRISTWRSRNDDKDEDEVKKDEKKFLNSSQKKKIAFINQEFHSTADTANAYIVFAHPVPAANRPANLPPPPEVLDPYDAARAAVRACDGSVFMERVIRVDLVGKKGVGTPGKGGEEDRGVELELAGADPKSSVFVGNLDFASKEEDLRVFFEGVLSAERGPPPADDEEVADGTVKKPSSWVARVRIVRDKETQLGKGFAYIQFTDHESVDEVLAMEPTKLKFAKRKLRVQRCRTLPGSSVSTRQATASKPTATDKTKRPAPVPIVVPKGDPALGEKLAHLPKDARKQAKAADADRVARRLAKKKARMAMGPGVKAQGKERERDRPRKGAAGGAAGSKKHGTGSNAKGRVRSEKSLAKRNGKKAGGGPGGK